MTAALIGRRRVLALAGLGMVMGAVPMARAHRAKAALTLVRLNRTSGVLEVEHTLHAHDAEMALNQIVKMPTPDLSQLEDRARLALYVEARFGLTVPGGPSLALKLLGAELDGEEVRVYQEMPMTAPPDRLSVRNMILRDVFPVQINQVNFDLYGDPGRTRTLTFLGGDGEKVVVLG
ncbi:MAG: hypothetical protein JHC88_13875 [Niveispirillum sp.]|nr:hypothetical protein [Niveispirillum sp.]